MSLRARAYLYLGILHAAFAASMVAVLGTGSTWLLAVEAATACSFAVGIALTRRALRSLELGAEATRLIKEGDFTARLRRVGDRQVDQLIDVYNAMVDTLRGERVRIQEQHHFLGEVIGASPSGMVVLDFDGRVSDVNPAGLRLLGLERDQVQGLPIGLIPSGLASSLAGLAPGTAVVLGLAGARRVRCYRGAFVERGFPRTFFVIEELTEDARRIERAAYEKLIRVMSHEVNNSITATNSLLESSLTYAAELPPASRIDVEQALHIAIERSAQLNLFMRRFADVFRLPAPVKAREDLHALLEALITLMRSRFTEVTLAWSWSSAAPRVWVEIDRGQMEQALLNIIKNAIEAAGSGGYVTVGVAAGPDEVVVTVDDSGPGPGTEAEAHLFTPFFSTKPHGQGIGLTLVQEILSAHGFGYDLEHLPAGPTRFTVRMPKASTTT